MKLELPYDPAITVLAKYPKDPIVHEIQCLLMLIHNSKEMESALMSING